MKWIILAGSNGTGKSYTLSELVLNLLGRGAVLSKACNLPSFNSAEKRFCDGEYELTYKGKHIIVKTKGAKENDICDGVDSAKSVGADVLISACREQPACSHLTFIESQWRADPSKLEIYFVASLCHEKGDMQDAMRKNRVGQIIDMI